MISRQEHTPPIGNRPARPHRLAGVSTRAKLLCLLLYIVALFQAVNPLSLGLCTVFAAAATALSGVSAAEIRGALKPLAFILLVTLIAQVLYCQTGEMLFCILGLPVHLDALLVSAAMVLRLLCIMAVSLAFMHCTTTQSLIDELARALAPLQKAGIRGEAFIIALDVALSTLPLLIDEFHSLSGSNRMPADDRKKPFPARMRAKAIAYREVAIGLLRDSFKRIDSIADTFAKGRSPEEPPPSAEPHKVLTFGNIAALALPATLLTCTLLI